MPSVRRTASPLTAFASRARRGTTTTKRRRQRRQPERQRQLIKQQVKKQITKNRNALARGVDPGVGVLTPLKICGRGSECVLSPPHKMSRSFIHNCCWLTLQVSSRQGLKTCVKNEM